METCNQSEQFALHWSAKIRKNICRCNSESRGNSYMSCLPGAETKMPGFLNTVEMNLNIQQTIEILLQNNL